MSKKEAAQPSVDTLIRAVLTTLAPYHLRTQALVLLMAYRQVSDKIKPPKETEE